MFHAPNKYRERNHPLLKSDDTLGNNGCFVIPHNKIANYVFFIQASDGMGWEHVSVSVGEKNKKQSRCPTRFEMCFIKSIFWDEEDCVIQYHPSKSEYVNLHQFVLHLWRPTDKMIPIPLKQMIG